MLLQKSRPWHRTPWRTATLAFLFAASGQISLLFADNVTGSTGSSSPMDNRQPTLVLRYIIATQGIYPNDDPIATPNEQSVQARDEPFLGEIRAIPFNFAPRGWMFCEGQLLPINQNQALFSLLLNAFGGDGRVNFALPDLRNRTPIGVGQGPGLPDYPLGAQVGNASPTLTKAQLPAHNHTVPSGTTSLIGNGAVFDNRQASLALRFLIRANGEILIVAWPQQPTGWAPCDGRLLPAATHTLLYNNIGTTYGGNSTNFALPDLRGRAAVADDGGFSWPRGLAFGSNDTVLSVADIPAHTHTITGGTTGSTGGTGNTANNYQPSLVVRWLVSFFGVYPSQTGTLSQTDGASSADSVQTGSLPFVGEIRLIAGATASGLFAGAWEPLNGELYAVSENNDLFNLIGNDYGGDGQESFGVPDLRARASVSSFSPDLPLASNVGSPTLPISLSQLAFHSHFVDLRISGIEHFADGSALITLHGMAGSTCKVDKSSDLITWSTLGLVQFSTSTATIPDPNDTNDPKRFYRAR